MGSRFWLPLPWKVYKYLLCVGSSMFSKLGAYRNAVGAARKHVVNWPELVLKAVLDSNGVFRSKAGGSISCDGKALLRQLTRLESVWRFYGDALGVIRFEKTSLVIPNYFGREFRIPLNARGVSPPKFFLKLYPFSVNGEVVLDIGAYLGDTPLMWLYRGAKSVIAVEPVPAHFQYLRKNVAGLPVIPLQASLGIQTPEIPSLIGSASYGIKEAENQTTDFLSTPIVSLIYLVNTYNPTVVKLNCEGCEHYVLDELVLLPKYNVKYLAVQFHSMKKIKLRDSLDFLEKKLGKGMVTSSSNDKVTVYWSF
jgi:FkbM family methyltransferase